MAQAQPQPKTPAQDPVKRRAVRRLIAALALIAIAVAGLALVERMARKKVMTPPPAPMAQSAAAPGAPAAPEPSIAASPTAEPAAPDVAGTQPPTEPPPPPKVGEPEAPPPPPPPAKAPPESTEGPTPAVAARTRPSPRDVTVKEVPARDLLPKLAPMPTPSTPPPAMAAPAAKTETPPTAPVKPAATVTPAPPAVPATPSLPAADTLSTPPPAAFVVQLGVFASPVNAESLRDRLKLAGIESHTETRLQVGPFTDRIEAERMLNRLRRLGVQAVLVPQVKEPFNVRQGPVEATTKPPVRK